MRNLRYIDQTIKTRIIMIQRIFNNTIPNLKEELKNDYPNLSDQDLVKAEESFDELVSIISKKTTGDAQMVKASINQRLEYLRSKGI